MNVAGTPPTTVLGSTFFTTTPSGYSPQSILKIFFIVFFFALKFEMYRFCKLFPILKSLNMAEVGHPPVDVFKIEHLCSSKDFVQLLV